MANVQKAARHQGAEMPPFIRHMLLAVAILVSAQLPTNSARSATDPAFDAWIADLRREALTKGISAGTFDAAFQGVAPIGRIIELDRRQPEFTQTFWGYMDRRLTDERIATGSEMLRTHGALLRRVEREYGVQARFLVAFWGLETNYGQYTGDYPVIAALATLAYDERRSAFFRSHLLDALRILEEGHISPDQMLGSWAGAMGQVQFMPETFRRYAVDFSGDGRRDIWGTLPDAFASAANFLRALGWDGERTWGREVRLPPRFDWELASLSVRKPLSEWQNLGVRRMDGRALPDVAIDASLVVPGGHRGPAFLVYDNFRAIIGWNASINYAISVGVLSDLISGGPGIETPRPTSDRPLSLDEVADMQHRLNYLGLDAGEPDGIVGRQTRAALRDYQRRIKVPADGYPTPELIQALREDTPGAGSVARGEVAE